MRVAIQVGDRYGRLSVVRELPVRRRPSGGTERWFLCRCECGNETDVRLSRLRSGKTRSCGCLIVPPKPSPASYANRADYHGMEGSPEHGIWRGIKARCYHPKARGYANYGGRGIKMCDRWKSSFKAFYEDMGPRPSPEHQIDRSDNDKDYEPGNCRWATRAEQNRNRKDNRMLEFRGERMCMADWAKRFGMRNGTLSDRLARGMSVEEALTTPVRQWIGSKG